tara:strand:+ start:741 stop:914 length:174 start_codon:yes stop_codon:yes gene_type:complete
MNIIDFVNDSMATIKLSYGVERNRKLEDKQKTFKMKNKKINKNKKKTKNQYNKNKIS